jgi:hypothetical protein
MATSTFGAGLALVALGLVGYAATGGVSPTALIPAAFGVPLSVAGWAARHPARKKIAMHIAVGLAVLGLLGSGRGLPQLAALLSGAEIARPAAAIAQSLMAVICATLVVLYVRSFVNARRQQASA